jgi:hypothetical protein
VHVGHAIDQRYHKVQPRFQNALELAEALHDVRLLLGNHGELHVFVSAEGRGGGEDVRKAYPEGRRKGRSCGTAASRVGGEGACAGAEDEHKTVVSARPKLVRKVSRSRAQHPCCTAQFGISMGHSVLCSGDSRR